MTVFYVTMAEPNTPSMLPRPDGQSLAYHHSPGFSPGVIFCPGFMSDMEGTKALALERAMKELNRSYTRFDYLGHGQSTGRFTDGTISRWTDDALAVLDECTAGPQIIVGSSMGGWIGLRMAMLRPERIKGFIGIAAAPDFTTRMWNEMPDEGKEAIRATGQWNQPSEYSDEPYVISRKLIEDGPRNFVLNGPVDITCPMHLLQGMQDDSVPWKTALEIQEAVASEDVTVTLVKNGDHRLSEPEDITRLILAVEQLVVKS